MSTYDKDIKHVLNLQKTFYKFKIYALILVHNFSTFH